MCTCYCHKCMCVCVWPRWSVKNQLAAPNYSDCFISGPVLNMFTCKRFLSVSSLSHTVLAETLQGEEPIGSPHGKSTADDANAGGQADVSRTGDDAD